MNKAKQFILSTILIAVPLRMTAAQQVNVAYDPNTDFARYQTYSFIESKNPAPSKVWEQSILDNIQLKLAMKGLLPARQNETSDLLIVYNAGVKEQTTIEGYSYGYGSDWRRLNDSDSRNHTTASAETLVIDLIDAQTNQLVWRGIAHKTLLEPTSTKHLKKIDKVTKAMFELYPPHQSAERPTDSKKAEEKTARKVRS